MSEIAPDMKLRISKELRAKIEKAARENGRTLNGEINVRLEQSFDSDLNSAIEELQSVVKMLLSDVDRLKYDYGILEVKVSHLEGR